MTLPSASKEDKELMKSTHFFSIGEQVSMAILESSSRSDSFSLKRFS